MFGGNPDDLQRLLAALAAGAELPGQGGAPGAGQAVVMGPPPGVSDAGREGGRPRGGQILLMSIPGMGIIGTGIPSDGQEGPSGESVGLAMRAAMEQVMRVVMEQSMEEQQQSNHAPPASETLRDALPRVVVTKEDRLDETNNKCAVCLEDYRLGAKATRMLCGHLFCTNCIREWLRTANSCPVCRFELATDQADYEQGREERMRGRQMRLKRGELRMMRAPELKRLMRALHISSDSCVEKGDLIKRLGEASAIEIAQDDQGILYEEGELQDLELPLLRNLLERHGLPKLPDDLTEEQERTEALENFATAGWMARKPADVSTEKPRQPEGATDSNETPAKEGAGSNEAPAEKAADSNEASVPEQEEAPAEAEETARSTPKASKAKKAGGQASSASRSGASSADRSGASSASRSGESSAGPSGASSPSRSRSSHSVDSGARRSSASAAQPPSPTRGLERQSSTSSSASHARRRSSASAAQPPSPTRGVERQSSTSSSASRARRHSGRAGD